MQWPWFMTTRHGARWIQDPVEVWFGWSGWTATPTRSIPKKPKLSTACLHVVERQSGCRWLTACLPALQTHTTTALNAAKPSGTAAGGALDRAEKRALPQATHPAEFRSGPAPSP